MCARVALWILRVSQMRMMQRFIRAASRAATSTPASRRHHVVHYPPIIISSHPPSLSSSHLGNSAASSYCASTRSLSSSSSSTAVESDNGSSPSRLTNSTANTSTIVQRHQRPIYVAATRQHVGKTSVSLALISHFTKRFGTENVGYMKAVGQQSLEVWDEPPSTIEVQPASQEQGQYVTIDKDVKLIREHFQMRHLQYADMSPILIPRGYTKSYLDGEIDHQGQMADIRRAYLNIVKSTSSPCNNDNVNSSWDGTSSAAGDEDDSNSSSAERRSITICEGTGHAGVGSVVGAGNARVAAVSISKSVPSGPHQGVDCRGAWRRHRERGAEGRLR